MALSYANITDVDARVGYPAMTATSKPTTDQASVWLEDAQNELDSTLLAIGHSPVPVTASKAVAICKKHIVDCAVAQVRITRAGSGGDSENDHGQELMEKCEATLDDIRANPNWWSAKLGAGAPAGGIRKLRAGGFIDTEPEIKLGEKF